MLCDRPTLAVAATPLGATGRRRVLSRDASARPRREQTARDHLVFILDLEAAEDAIESEKIWEVGESCMRVWLNQQQEGKQV